jgi:Fe-S-cluster containining protein
LELRPRDAVDLADEPESFAELPGGDRLVVLRQRDGGCIFLGAEEGGAESCTVHSARPLSCRAYPFDRRPGPSEIVGVHAAALCPPETGHLAVVQQGGTTAAEWARVVDDRDRELREHTDWLADFNRRQRLRRRLGKPRRDPEAFLQELAAPSSAVLAEDAAHAAEISSAEEVQVDEQRIELMKR